MICQQRVPHTTDLASLALGGDPFQSIPIFAESHLTLSATATRFSFERFRAAEPFASSSLKELRPATTALESMLPASDSALGMAYVCTETIGETI